MPAKAVNRGTSTPIEAISELLPWYASVHRGAGAASVYLGVLHGLGDRQLKRAFIAMRAAGVTGR